MPVLDADFEIDLAFVEGTQPGAERGQSFGDPIVFGGGEPGAETEPFDDQALVLPVGGQVVFFPSVTPEQSSVDQVSFLLAQVTDSSHCTPESGTGGILPRYQAISSVQWKY